MATRIQSLFLVRASLVIANNEDWLDAIAFLDAEGAPIPLAGIRFRTVVRTSRESHAVYLGLGSPGIVLDLPSSTPRGLMISGGNVLAFSASFGDETGLRPQAGDYVFDTLAEADGLTRRVIDGVLTILEGVTR